MAKKTIHEAWLHLAKFLDAAPDGNVQFLVERYLCYGLCNAVEELALCDVITESTYAAMRRQIKEYAPSGTYYRWDLGDHGSRADFCRRMAKLSKPKGEKQCQPKTKKPAARASQSASSRRRS